MTVIQSISRRIVEVSFEFGGISVESVTNSVTVAVSAIIEKLDMSFPIIVSHWQADSLLDLWLRILLVVRLATQIKVIGCSRRHVCVYRFFL